MMSFIIGYVLGAALWLSGCWLYLHVKDRH
jgi:hypothetical protein